MKCFALFVLVLALASCSKDGSTASGEASAPIAPDDEDAGTTALLPTIDLPGSVSLGSSELRPSLSNPCIHGEYAERLGKHVIVLSCVTVDTPYHEQIQMGIYGSQDERPQLAFFKTSHTPGASELDVQSQFAQHLADFQTLYGPPHDRASGDEPMALWAGHGRLESAPTTLELKLEGQAIHVTYTHVHLYGRLGL